MLKALYNAIAERLSNIQSQGAPVLKQIELWNNQWAYEAEGIALQFPCCFIEFQNLPMEQVSQDRQQSTAVIALHLGAKTVTENAYGRPNHDKYNEHLDLIDVVSYWMSRFSGTFFSTFRRISIDVDHNHDQLVAHKVTFHTRVNDDVAMRPKVQITGDIIQIDFENSTETEQLYIGKYHQGGKIFLLDETGQHGLICAPHDLSTTIPWAPAWLPDGQPIYTGAADTAVGTGAGNTDIIVAAIGDTAENYAAKACKAYSNDDFTDWFLPSRDELRAMWVNLHLEGKGDFSTNANYWSSSESTNEGQTDEYAIACQFVDDPQYESLDPATKSLPLRVRPVRAF